MGRVGAFLRPLWVRLGVVVVVCAVAGALVVAVGRPALFTATAASASSERGYHCTPHQASDKDDAERGTDKDDTVKHDADKHATDKDDTDKHDTDKDDSCKPKH